MHGDGKNLEFAASAVRVCVGDEKKIKFYFYC